MGNAGTERLEAAAVDAYGRLFYAGLYSDTISFGGDTHEVTQEQSEIWAACLAADGTALWSLAIHKSAPSPRDAVTDIVPDGDGGAWLSTILYGSATIANETITIASGKRRVILLHVDEQGAIETVIQSTEIAASIGGGPQSLIRRGNTLYLATYLKGANLFTPFDFAGLTAARHGLYVIAIDAPSAEGQWMERVGGYNEGIADLRMSESGDLLAIGVNDDDLTYGSLELANLKAGQPYVLAIDPETGAARDGWFLSSCESCRTFISFLQGALVGADIALSYYEFEGGLGETR